MNNSPLPLVAGLLGAGLLGGFAARLFPPAPQVAPPAPSAIAPRTSNPEPSAAALESMRQIEELTLRVEQLELAPRVASRQPVQSTDLGIPPEQLEEALAAALAGQGGGASSVQNLVAAELDQIRAQEETQRGIARQERRTSQLDKRIQDLTEKLSLYPHQATQLFGILEDEGIKRDELRKAMRDGTGSMEDWPALFEATHAAVNEVLDSGQFELYQESLPFFGRGPGGPRRGQTTPAATPTSGQ